MSAFSREVIGERNAPVPAASYHAPARPLSRPQPTWGNQAMLHLLRTGKIQAKLAISQPGDPYEREADQVADAVLQIPDAAPGTRTRIQRLCPDCEQEEMHRKAEGKEEEEQGVLQAKESPASTPAAPPPLETGIQSLHGGGRPLPAAERSFFEPRFGRDLSRVRVHTDRRANEAAAAVRARAFTLGSDIVFATGQYVPQSAEGQHLLAHELTHVAQQSSQGSGNMCLQRAVKEENVSCHTYGLTGGVPGGFISGLDAVAVVTAANERAVELTRRAENLLFIERVFSGFPGLSPDSGFAAALTNRFGLSVANPAHHRRITLLEREFKAVADFLDGDSIHYVCRDPNCGRSWWAFAIPGRSTLHLCNPFWTATSLNLQGSTLLHEAFHIWWDQIDDHGKPAMHNAHCFEQFALDLAGATAEIPSDFTTACKV